jgi:hypothetical protein
MRQDGRPGRAWRRADRQASTTDRQVSAIVAKAHFSPLERELTLLQRVFTQAGRVDALADALELCERERLLPPAWLTRAIADVLRQREVREQDLIDLARMDAVENARDHGLTWERAYRFAEELLAPTAARGSAAAMKKSRQVVLARRQREPGRYLITRAMARGLRGFDPPREHLHMILARYEEGHGPKE